MKEKMENLKKDSVKKENLKSDVITGASSALGATVGMMAGSTITARAAEPEDEVVENTEETVASSHAHHVSPSVNVEDDTVAGSNVEESTAEPEPSEQEPIEAEPVETEPVDSEPVESDPVETNPMEPEPIAAVDDEVMVLDYSTVTNDDGSQMDVAVVSVGGEVACIVDLDQDGVADVLLSDENGNDEIEANEVQDIEGEGIFMSSFQSGMIEDSHLSEPYSGDDDYVNDAHIDDFMA